MFYTIRSPEIPITKHEQARPGLCIDLSEHNGKPIYSRVLWRGVGRVAPPFFHGRMENGPNELLSLCGTFCEVVAVRYRHRFWHSLAQHMQRCKVAVTEKLRWDRIMDDYF